MEGGRTGLTALVTAVMFIAALFIARLQVGSVGSNSSGAYNRCVMMMSAVKEIDFEDFTKHCLHSLQ